MYPEEDFLQLSALQHFIFCQRQCALIHIEQAWVENQFTAEGRVMHDTVHEEMSGKRKGIRIESGVPLRSCELGLSGKADVVEFPRNDAGQWIPFPIEYKRGKPKIDDSDKVQLCAQALCLEEVLGLRIPEGALFYGKTRRRLEVPFDDALRRLTKDTVCRLHEFIEKGKTPKPVYTPKCDSCSFLHLCMPKTIERGVSVKKYLFEEIQKP